MKEDMPKIGDKVQGLEGLQGSLNQLLERCIDELNEGKKSVFVASLKNADSAITISVSSGSVEDAQGLALALKHFITQYIVKDGGADCGN